MNRSVLVSAPLLAAVLTVTGCQSSRAAEESAPVAPAAVDIAVVTVSASPFEEAVELSGTLTPRSRVPVRPRLPGTLERVLVELGDAVRQGQTIATIDRREIDAQADAAEAAVAVARASLENAAAGLANALTEDERARVLFEKGAIPRQRLDAAETAHRAARAQRDLAQANLAQSEAALRRAREVQRDATLLSPVTGFVVERNYDAGAIPGDLPIVVVADLRQMKLEAGVSELEAGRLRVGMIARVEVQARPGETFTGEVAAIAPEVNERNRHFRVEVRVPNTDHGLLSGMYATARIIRATADDALLLPREAIVTQEGRRVAMKVDGETISPVPVTEGATDGRQVQILAGLASGDRVLADARRQPPAGTRVRPIDVR